MPEPDKLQPISSPKTCTCCGGDAGKRPQWWNQDAGYSLCDDCIDFAGRRTTEADFRQTYGEPGIHYARLPNSLTAA